MTIFITWWYSRYWSTCVPTQVSATSLLIRILSIGTTWKALQEVDSRIALSPWLIQHRAKYDCIKHCALELTSPLDLERLLNLAGTTCLIQSPPSLLPGPLLLQGL